MVFRGFGGSLKEKKGGGQGKKELAGTSLDSFLHHSGSRVDEVGGLD